MSQCYESDIANLLGWSPSSVLRAVDGFNSDINSNRDTQCRPTSSAHDVIDLTDSPSSFPTEAVSATGYHFSMDKIIGLEPRSDSFPPPFKRPREVNLARVEQDLSTHIPRHSLSEIKDSDCRHFTLAAEEHTTASHNCTLPDATSSLAEHRHGQREGLYSMQSTPLVDLRCSTEYLCVVIDIETTGFSPRSEHIIQLAARANWERPNEFCASDSFSEYVSLPVSRGKRIKVPYHITKLTGITAKMLRAKGVPFDKMWCKFLRWLESCSRRRCASSSGKPVVMVAHNGKMFDFPFLQATLTRFQLHHEWEKRANVICFLDSLLILRSEKAWTSDSSSNDRTTNYYHSDSAAGEVLCERPHKLGMGPLHQHLFNRKIAGAHNAATDVNALCNILNSPILRHRWKGVGNYMQFRRNEHHWLTASEDIAV